MFDPIFVPPCLAGCDSEGHHAGMYGINSLNVIVKFARTANRAWRCCKFPSSDETATSTYYNKSATLVNVEDDKLIVKFYTPKGPQLQDPRSVVNFHDFKLFRTINLPTIAPHTTDKRRHGIVAASSDANAGKLPVFNKQH